MPVLLWLLRVLPGVAAHSVVGYFEKKAVQSYTLYLQQIDAGRVNNVAAPAIARHYWRLADEARLPDVVPVVRADNTRPRR